MCFPFLSFPFLCRRSLQENHEYIIEKDVKLRHRYNISINILFKDCLNTLLRQISRVFLPTLFVPIMLVRYVLYLVYKPLLADVGNYVARHTFKDRRHPV